MRVRKDKYKTYNSWEVNWEVRLQTIGICDFHVYTTEIPQHINVFYSPESQTEGKIHIR